MKKQLKHFGVGTFMALTLCTVRVAVAGERGGNGGDAVVCSGNTRVLDEIEFESKGLNYISDDSKDYRSQVSDVLNNLKSKMPKMAEEIKSYADDLLTDVDSFKKVTRNQSSFAYKVSLFSTANLLDVDDSELESIPQGCTVKQLARHNDKIVGFEKKYVFDSKIFKNLSDRSISSIVLHESIFRYLKENYSYSNAIYSEKVAFTSKNARHFHNLISSEEVNTLSVVDFLSYLNDLTIAYFKLDGAQVTFLRIINNQKAEIYSKLDSDVRTLKLAGLGIITFGGEEDCVSWETTYYTVSNGNGDGTYYYTQDSRTSCAVHDGFEREAELAVDFPVRLKKVKLYVRDRLVSSL